MANAFVCAVAFLVLVLSPLRDNHDSLANYNPHDASRSQANAQPSKAGVDCKDTGCPKTQTTPSDSKSTDNLPDYLFWGTIVNGVLALGTTVIAIFSVIQAVAANRSSKAAEGTLKLLAADIHVEAMGLVPQGTIAPRSYVAVKLKNYGSSRAEKVRSFIKVTIDGLPDSEYSPEEFIIPQGGTQSVRFMEFQQFLNQPTFLDIASGSLKLRVCGRVTYMDIFGDSRTLELKEGILDPKTGSFLMGQPPEEQKNGQP
jgi:hypothetical protein